MREDSDEILQILIGRNIRNFRQKAGISHQAICDKLGFTLHQFQSYELGIEQINVLDLIKIARFLRVPVAVFVEGAIPLKLIENTNHLNLPDTGLEAVIRLWPYISPAMKNHLLDSMRLLVKNVDQPAEVVH